ncbi:Triacylglycerol lipase [Cordyceps fumosorosea ARSEF 2679]|uniref:Triacylglycerol lipase n=1 Tax=Cordyceps fumosorosea (strain ARSEF 2679) TaxID=1081104 RepID=A0A168E0K1_CORFA|nr:Triacylglycerol lipase [Cordyceps fumosorosea ARSEF 2679]OAA73233.1 Triacylglycerol lipase [Cordyceps fumosorosea ARSEF 2679]
MHTHFTFAPLAISRHILAKKSTRCTRAPERSPSSRFLALAFVDPLALVRRPTLLVKAILGMFGALLAVWRVIVEVVSFWRKKLFGWYTRKNPVDLWLELLRHAEAFEDWEEAALHLDNLLGLDLWRNNPTSKYYDWRLITERLNSLAIAREENDIQQLVNLLRSGLVRNLGNLTVPKLYNRSFSGTKYLIEEYITQVAETVEDISTLPANASAGIPSIGGSLTNQMKLDFIHDTRQAFGRSSLVLQGGAIFGMCHLGVVKALFLRGLLPRIITGTGTGALIASLVAIHTEEELPGVLNGDGIDLTAFSSRGKLSNGIAESSQTFRARWDTLMRRLRRFSREGYFLDVSVLEDCVRANVGDLTFEEAYNYSKRILNITVATEGQGGVPTLLNYITAPNVLIWTAAVASNASSAALYGRRKATILCKDAHGNVGPWAPANTTDFHHWSHMSYSDRDSPLRRISELFNVNHFIVSQARPYLIPFLQSDMHGPSMVETRSKTTQLSASVVRMVGLEVRHRLRQLDTLRLLPASIRRFLVDEQIPAAAMTLVPEVTAGDFVRLLETPTREALNYWILRGERSVWPAVAALRIRCAVENELDRSYQVVRQLKAGDLRRKGSISAAGEVGRTSN